MPELAKYTEEEAWKILRRDWPEMVPGCEDALKRDPEDKIAEMVEMLEAFN